MEAATDAEDYGADEAVVFPCPPCFLQMIQLCMASRSPTLPSQYAPIGGSHARTSEK